MLEKDIEGSVELLDANYITAEQYLFGQILNGVIIASDRYSCKCAKETINRAKEIYNLAKDDFSKLKE